MDLYFKTHPSNFEVYIAPLALHENTKYADAFMKHFKPHSLGFTSWREFEEFKMVALLHGHTIIVEG